MNQRIKTLREQSLKAVNTLSAERALLITKYYSSQQVEGCPTPILRAQAFDYLMSHKSICINPGELIVGERGPAPKAAPTYPEVCLHSLDDLQLISTRPKVSFRVDEETFRVYRDTIIPFWRGKTLRDMIFSSVSEEWRKAYDAGVFTEFQEQRAPGHTVAGKKVFQKGMLDLIDDVDASLNKLTKDNNGCTKAKIEELEAMRIAANAIIKFANRYADELERLAKIEVDANRRVELGEMAAICRRVPAHAPQTFHEALQHYWFIHLGVITELNPWDSFNPGRLDQHLYPFYLNDIKEGKLTHEGAVELLQAFWVKFNNHPSPPKMGVTAEESNTYTDFTLVNLGGVKEDGSDAVNELTYTILDVIEEMRILQPSSMVQVSKKNPDRFVKRAVKIVKTGFGQPSFFNSDAIVQELLSQGKSLTDARNGGASGCVETGAFGTEAYILTGYFNLNKVLELTLNNGVDPLTGKEIGIRTGNAASFKTFNQLYEAFERQLGYFSDVKLEGNLVIERIWAEEMPVPFLSLLIDDCIANATDYNAGGARYNTSYVQGVGLGSITDNLSALSRLVFDEEALSMDELLKAMNANFEGYDDLRYRLIYDMPKWGNNNDYADKLAVRVFNSFYKAITGRKTFRGGVFRINMLPTTSHVYFGSKIGAMPDGRLAHEPLSEGISPVQGADRNGPTAVILSAAKIDQIKTGGTLLNQKFSPSFFTTDESLDKMVSLIRSYFKLDGHHIQFNVVSADTLRDAQKHPEKYQDLIVRVAGYSDYFNDLGEALQNEIIRRTEHEAV
ncbi:MAG TPA: glycyl radical protein [Tenuifilaceae bacterium]|nr:glycyl radical protein [Tenuifilaceae bacterium]HOC37151.1 glycyl radical protein [Tenuifilaceae bacterium]HOG72930.1 glycyl radical protein [Tenuifilaceae bacterium]HPA68113.1 glycyl radical protein [Tenuifilaceae bacterium]HQN84498.1 glycyl radical protein [Tenuifilaceae bacterium]